MKTLDQIIKKLPTERRAKIAARAGTLIAEEAALQQLRRHASSQQRMAELLGIGQDSLSRIENRSDLLLSTLRSYVEAMGGTLKLVINFPEGSAVLSSLGETEDEDAAQPTKKTTKRARRLSIVPADS